MTGHPVLKFSHLNEMMYEAISAGYGTRRGIAEVNNSGPDFGPDSGPDSGDYGINGTKEGFTEMSNIRRHVQEVQL